MEGINDPLQCILFILCNTIFTILLIITYLIQQPFRLLRRLTLLLPGQQQQPRRKLRPKVHVTTVESQREGGEQTPKDTILLIHGFPDSPTLWSSTVRRLTQAGYRCIVAALPGSRGQAVDKFIPPSMVIDQLESTIKQHDSITVVGHDWGALYGMLFKQKFSSRVHRLILLDIGVTKSRNVHWLLLLCIMSYQVMFCLAYYVAHPIGTYFVRFRLRLWNYVVRPLEEIQSDMTWFYPCIFSEIFAEMQRRQELKKTKNITRHSKDLVGIGKHIITGNENVKAIPTLFVYGKKKIFNFHDSEFIQQVSNTPHGLVEALDCGHWLQHEKEKEWISILLKWLDCSKSVVSNRIINSKH